MAAHPSRQTSVVPTLASYQRMFGMALWYKAREDFKESDLSATAMATSASSRSAPPSAARVMRSPRATRRSRRGERRGHIPRRARPRDRRRGHRTRRTRALGERRPLRDTRARRLARGVLRHPDGPHVQRRAAPRERPLRDYAPLNCTPSNTSVGASVEEYFHGSLPTSQVVAANLELGLDRADGVRSWDDLGGRWLRFHRLRLLRTRLHRLRGRRRDRKGWFDGWRRDRLLDGLRLDDRRDSACSA